MYAVYAPSLPFNGVAHVGSSFSLILSVSSSTHKELKYIRNKTFLRNDKEQLLGSWYPERLVVIHNMMDGNSFRGGGNRCPFYRRSFILGSSFATAARLQTLQYFFIIEHRCSINNAPNSASSLNFKRAVKCAWELKSISRLVRGKMTVRRIVNAGKWRL